MADESVLIITNDADESRLVKLLNHYQFVPFVIGNFNKVAGLLENNNFFATILDKRLDDSAFEEISKLINQFNIPLIMLSSEAYNSAFRNKVENKKILDFVHKKDESSLEQTVQILLRLRKNNLMKVLVVDDSKFARSLSKSILETARFQVITAADGSKALEILQTTPDISIVLTDYEMPVMDGLELLKEIRKQFDRNVLAVIAVSQMSAQTHISSFLKNGANDYILKPYTNDELYCRVLNHAELVESYRAIDRINQDLNYVLGMASHDIRGPLGGISGLTHQILEDTEAAGSNSYSDTFQIIAETADHVLSMVNSLLDISMIEHKEYELKKTEASLTELIRQRIQQIFAKSAELKNIKLIFSPESDIVLKIDKTRIIQVLDNLISNAIKFTPASGKVTIDIKKTDKNVRFDILDTGPGLTKTDMEHVFQQFRKLSAVPTSGEKSVGLGLSICKRIIELHGGDIGVQTGAEGGADFYFYLPL